MKNDLLEYVKENGAQFREDPSNESDAYLRNRLRHHIVPAIMLENPSAALNAVKMTTGLQEDEKLLEAWRKSNSLSIVTFTEDGFPTLHTDLFRIMHTALQKRFIPLLLNYLYSRENIPVEYSAALLHQLHHHLSASEGNVTIDLPKGYRFVREYGIVSIVKDVENTERSQRLLRKGQWTGWGNLLLYWDDADGHDVKDGEIKYFDLPEADLPLHVRGRKDGDRILLPGMAQPKRLSRLFIDEKIGAEKRRNLPVITTALGEICAIPGVTIWHPVQECENRTGKVHIQSKRTAKNLMEKRGNSMLQNDIEEVLITEEEIQEKVAELGAVLTADYQDKFPLAIGVLKGALPFMSDLIKRVDAYIELDFMDVSSYGNATVSSGEVKIVKDLNTSVEGRDVLIIEDIIDSGKTLNYLVELFKYRKAKSIKIVTLLDKPTGRKVDLKADYVGFLVPDAFVVGYGLDYAEKYRNLPYIGVLKKEIYSF